MSDKPILEPMAKVVEENGYLGIYIDDYRVHSWGPGAEKQASEEVAVINAAMQTAINAERNRAIEECADIADQHNSCEGIAQAIAKEIRAIKRGGEQEGR